MEIMETTELEKTKAHITVEIFEYLPNDKLIIHQLPNYQLPNYHLPYNQLLNNPLLNNKFLKNQHQT